MNSTGSHGDLNSTTPTLLGTPHTPMFGSNLNVPFIFNQSATPSTPHQHPWAPPPSFSPEKAFPKTTIQEEPNDVDMSDISPLKAEDRKVDSGRTMASGALRRVFKSRQKSRDDRVARGQRQGENDDPDYSDSEDEADGSMAMTQNTSNHYTLNMPAPPPPQSDLPYVLLGLVYFCFLKYLSDALQLSSICVQSITHPPILIRCRPIYPHGAT